MLVRNIHVLALLAYFVAFVSSDDEYTGAVVEYRRRSIDPDPEKNSIGNALIHRDIVRNICANAKVDIIVFPENALDNPKPGNPFAIPIPAANEKRTACSNNTDSSKLLETLSCTAQMYKVYLVVNLLEEYTFENNTHYYYNTDVAFDRNGTVIARYRKHNLWSRKLSDVITISKPLSSELVYFDTDFGVRFGMFTCFDIVFKTPAVDLVDKSKISHFVFPTHWFAEMPFLTAIQAQYSWAAGNNVVLLAAGINDPINGSTGTGIYIGTNNNPKSYFQTIHSTDFAIIRTIPKHISKPTSVTGEDVIQLIEMGDNDDDDDYNLYSMEPVDINRVWNKNPFAERNSKLTVKHDKSVPYFVSELIKENETLDCTSPMHCSTIQSVMMETICRGNFCCTFSYTLENYYYKEIAGEKLPDVSSDHFGSNYYRLAVFDGMKDYDGRDKSHLQICAVLSCTDTNLDSCGMPTYGKPPTTFEFNGTNYLKRSSTFVDIQISAKFSDKSTLIMPNVLFSKVNEGTFGSLGTENSFSFSKKHFSERRLIQADIKKAHPSPSSLIKTTNMGLFGIYCRVFNEDRNGSGIPLTDNNLLIALMLVFFARYFM